MDDRARARLPDDPTLAAIVARARTELRDVDALGALLLGDDGAGLPDGSAEVEAADRQRLLALLAAVEATPSLTDPKDEVDRKALLYGLRRALPPDGPRPPTGALLLERHLLARLPRLARDPRRHGPELAEVVEQAPAFLARCRQGCLGAPAPAGEVALGAAKRLPALLDVVAGAADAPDLRTRLEAGLGPLLAAAAEEGGWILKEYMPAAGDLRRRADIVESATDLGLGASLEQLESAAEASLAEQAAIAYENVDPEANPDDTDLQDWSAAAVAARWEVVAPLAEAWCGGPAGPVGELCEVEPAPAWLQPLLPPLALVNPGPLTALPFRLLVGPSLSGTQDDIDAQLSAICLLELLPAAWQRSRTRMARLLLPATDVVAAWQARVRSTAPGLRDWRPADARREAAWRSILALVAAGFIRDRLDLDEAASLVAAETGMDADTARLQAAHVASQPLAALAEVAGKPFLEGAMPGLDGTPDAAAARARILATGPVPVGSVGPVAGYTP